ncbi:hypothetical protein [Ureaplasma urealyticum]|uniref:hypothetical protein n=1 Tax=Ureaplasma urealyticum TaxID=2130 RepID=UPI0002DEB2C1|nr:hypothetical protein [Ureaplasma urealyticum]
MKIFKHKTKKITILMTSIIFASLSTIFIATACSKQKREEEKTKENKNIIKLKDLVQQAQQIYNKIKNNKLLENDIYLLNNQITKSLEIIKKDNLNNKIVDEYYKELNTLLNNIQKKVSIQEQQKRELINKEITIKLQNLNQLIDHDLLKNNQLFFDEVIDLKPITLEIQTLINQAKDYVNLKNDELTLKSKTITDFINKLQNKIKNIIDELFNNKDSYINKFLDLITNQKFINDNKYKERTKFDPNNYLELIKSIRKSFDKLKNVEVNLKLDQFLKSLNSTLLSLSSETKTFLTKFEDELSKYFKWIAYGKDDSLTKLLNRITQTNKKSEFDNKIKDALLSFPLEINQKLKSFVDFFILKNNDNKTAFETLRNKQFSEVNQVWSGIAQCFTSNECTDTKN